MTLPRVAATLGSHLANAVGVQPASTLNCISTFPLDRNYDLVSSAIFDLRQMDLKHAVFQAGGRIAHAERPTQRNDARKLSITSLRAKIRHDTPARRTAFLFAPDSQPRVSQTNLYLLSTHAG